MDDDMGRRYEARRVHPILFRLGDVAIYSYGVMVMVALGVGFGAILLAALRLRYSMAAAAVIGCLLPFPLLLGAKAGWWVTNLEELTRQGGWMSGGLMLTPGLLLALAAAAVMTFAFKERVGATLDVAVIGLAGGVAVGRFGCFLAGCCFGRPTELPWGLVFPASGLMPEALHGVRLHPTQLYLLLAFALLAVGLSWRGLRRRFPGELSLVAIAAYGLVSVFDPFLRYGSEPSPWSLFGWSAVVVIALALVVVLARRGSLVTAAPPP